MQKTSDYFALPLMLGIVHLKPLAFFVNMK